MLFADDTSLLAKGKDPTETTAILNRGLAKIEIKQMLYIQEARLVRLMQKQSVMLLVLVR